MLFPIVASIPTMRLFAFHAIVAFTDLTVDLSLLLYVLSIEEMIAHLTGVILILVCIHELLDFDLANILKLVLRDDGLNIMHVDWCLAFLSWTE